MLIQFKPESNKYLKHNEFSDLLQASILKIVPGRSGKTWLLSEQLIIEYEPITRTYNLYQGGLDIDADRFLNANPDSHGMLMAGTIGGIAYVSPSAIPDTMEIAMKPQITDITVDGKSMIFNEEKSIQPDKLTLESENHNIVFHLSTHDNINADKVRYAYRMKGFDKQWSYTKRGDNKAVYNYLPKGTYTLEAKVCDPHNRWSTPENLLKVDRKPAFTKPGGQQAY